MSNIRIKIIKTEVVQEDHQIRLRLYGRDKDGQFDTIDVMDIEPYFFGVTDQVKEIQDSLINSGPVQSIDHDAEKEGYKGESLSKITIDAPWNAAKITKAYDGVQWFESDVWADNQFRIDFGLFTGVEAPSRRVDYADLTAVDFPEPTPRISMIDIETDDRGEFVDDGSRPILSIVAQDSYTEETVAFFWTGPDRSIGECFPDGRPERVDRLEYTTTEKSMLRKFVDYIQKTNPDLMSGWNYEDFDAPYLYRRFEEIGLDPGSLSREGFAKDRGFKGVEFKGRTQYDLLQAYKNTKWTELESYKLDFIAQKELGDAKIPHEDMGYYEMYEKDPTKLINYNAQDVHLCVRINEKAEVIQFWSILRDELGLDFEDTRANNDFIEMMARRDLHEHGLSGPATDYSRQPGDYDGGYVFDAHTGVEQNVLAIDLASLYPYTMWMSNASPETKVADENVETLRRAGISVCEAPNGANFRLDKDGVFKRLVDKAIGLKSEYKTKRNAATPGTPEHKKFAEKYAVAKTVTNSVYGTAGWEKFFLYDEQVAEAITLLGQASIKATAKYINENTVGNVIYGDTDSCYISLPDEWDISECIEWGEGVCNTLNDEVYPELAEEYGIPASMNKWDIEPEALVTFFQAGKKKRYATKAVWEDGHYLDEPKYGVKGFDSKRSDTAKITEELQESIFKLILDGEDEQEIMELVSAAADEISPKNSDLTRIGIPGGIGKELEDYDTEGAQVRGARFMNELCGTDIGQGDKPRRVYLRPTLRVGEGKDSEPVDVISFEDVEDIPVIVREKLEVDTAAMTEKTITNKMKPILSAVGVDTNAVLKSQVQTGIAAFL